MDKKNIFYFAMTISVLLLTSLGSFYIFKHLGVEDARAKNLVELVTYPVAGLMVLLGGLNLLGVNNKNKRLLALICLTFFIRAIVGLGLEQLGVGRKAASIIGIGVWLAMTLIVIFGVYNKFPDNTRKV